MSMIGTLIGTANPPLRRHRVDNPWAMLPPIVKKQCLPEHGDLFDGINGMYRSNEAEMKKDRPTGLQAGRGDIEYSGILAVVDTERILVAQNQAVALPRMLEPEKRPLHVDQQPVTLHIEVKGNLKDQALEDQ